MKAVNIKVVAFRPTEAEQKALLRGQVLSGRKPSELLRHCLRTALERVVTDLTSDHQSKVQTFTEACAEMVASPMPTGEKRARRNKTKGDKK